MSAPTTSSLSGSATSSPVSVAGPTPSSSPVGLTISKSGPVAAHASLTARQAKARGLLMSGISGPLGTTSSTSAALGASLESRLRAKLPSGGGTLFTLTWRYRNTPAGLPICALRASAHRTSASGCTSWPTPNAGPQNDNDGTWEQRREVLKRKHGNGNGFGLNLGQAVTLSAWPTTAARDWKSSASNKHGGNARPLNEVARLSSWATPLASDADKTDATPLVIPRRIHDQGRSLSTTMQVRLTGSMSSGSPAETGKPVQLNPAFSRWLMGYLPEWDDCGVTAMPSSRKSRQK